MQAIGSRWRRGLFRKPLFGPEMSGVLVKRRDTPDSNARVDDRHRTERFVQRAVDRYRVMGTARLTHAGMAINGHLVDLSMRGVGLMIENLPPAKISPAMSWLCQIESKALPCQLTVIVRVVRQKKWRDGAELGCEIIAINDKALRVLNAFRALSAGKKSRRGQRASCF